jgi:hypothetical protein
MHSTIKMNRLTLASIVLGLAGGLWALGGQPAKAHSPAPAQAVQAAPDVCAIAASVAGEGNPLLAADLRRAVGCAPA